MILLMFCLFITVIFLLATENWHFVLWFGMTECHKENFVLCIFFFSDLFFSPFEVCFLPLDQSGDLL